jgi:NADH-quinone oxidoreductase subunit M
MMLLWLILIPLLGGAAAWLAGRAREAAARWVALASVTAALALALVLWVRAPVAPLPGDGDRWTLELVWDWMPRLGIGFHLALDGLSLLLIVLTLFIAVLSVVASWTEVSQRVPFFHFNLLWVVAGIIGVFLAMDLFLFFFFWELTLVPVYLLIAIWGHQNRVYAAVKFFIFTQVSGLLMLVAIAAMGWLHLGQFGVLSFAYQDLLAVDVPARIAPWLMLGFFLAFAVKLPAVPFHTWLPDAHTEAPTAGSVILAALLLKTGGYGLIRFAVPLFPEVSAAFAPLAMTLGVAGILYGAVVAFAQTDLKRLVAYTSIAHLGFVLLGVYSWNELALQGVVLQMVVHGLSTGGLFILVGQLYERLGTRDLSRMGGLWGVAPRMGAVAMVLAMASLGLPGLGNFVAEFLVLSGAFRVAAPLAAVAMLGAVFAVVYALRIAQRTFHGADVEGWRVPDLSARETAVMAAVVLTIVWLGLYPQPVLDTAAPALEWLGIAQPPTLASGGGG